MDSILSACLLFAPFAAAGPANPIKITGSTWLGNGQVSTNDGNDIARDGGWQGSIGGTVVQVYADTSRGNTFIAPNTIVAQTFVATEVTDFSDGPSVFCSTSGTDSGSNDRLHVTSLIPTGDSTGAIWYVDLADSSGCNEVDGCPTTAGVASVTMVDSVPVCSALPGYWNPANEPVWGSSSAIGPLLDGYIYLMGQLDGAAPGSSYMDVYVARVPEGSALDYSSYQYWNGSAFDSERLIDPNFNGWSPAAVLGNVGDFGSWFYSNYYNQYVVLTTNTSVGNQVLAYTAEQPWGPYSDPVQIYQNSSFGGYYEPIYSPQALPTFDNSGKTLTFVASLFGVNSVSGVIKVDFA